MAKQRHDIGWKKRHQVHPARTGIRFVGGQRLARDLVNRGLASPIILGEISPYRGANK